MTDITLVLDNIRSTHNVGSIFRTADGFSVSKIYLCGVTPAPVDRFGRARADIAKVALGAEKTITWEQTKDTLSTVLQLKKAGYTCVALEQSENSILLQKYKTPKKPIALILGEETKGLSKEILDACDVIVEIPMHGNKESFNVAVATGIALYAIQHLGNST